MQSTQKETFNSFHCYFNYYFALVDRAVHLSILLDFDRCLQITTRYHYDSRHNGSLKCQPWRTSNNSWCKTQPMQWMWNSVFISLVTMFLVCATSSLAGYVLAKNVSMDNAFSLQSLSLPWLFQNKLSLYHWYVSSTSWESMILFGQLSCL